eukprot:gene17863-19644_t
MQARKATIDVEAADLQSLVADLKQLREKWLQIVDECILVATAMSISAEFLTEQLILAGITTHYEAAYHINELFSFLWQYLELSDEAIHDARVKFGKRYGHDSSPVVLEEEVVHMKTVDITSFGEKALNPHAVLNQIARFHLEEIFYNVRTALRIFCTLSVTVASAERFFSKLKLIKNFLQSTLTQEKLTDLAVLSIENDIAKTLDFKDIINDFANMKARKLLFQVSSTTTAGNYVKYCIFATIAR